MALSFAEALALAALRDAGLVVGLPRVAHCPRCHRVTGRSPGGHVYYCEACTIRDVGLTPWENARRIEARMTVAAWLRRPADEPPPEPRASAAKRRMTGR